MKYIIVNEKSNPHLKRKEITISVDHVGGATPSLSGLQEVLSKDLKVEPEKVEIRSLFSLKGHAKSKGNIFIWDEKRVENLSKPKEEKPTEESAN